MTDEKKEDLETRYKKLWQEDPNKFAIITCLGWYGSINLKKLSSLIGKPETTTLRYIKQLIDDGLIEVDAEKTASSWGKYYRLVDEVAKLYKKNLDDFVKEGSELDKKLAHLKQLSEEEIRREIAQKLIPPKDAKYSAPKAFKQFLSFIHNIENSIINQLVDLEKEFQEEVENPEIYFERYPHLIPDNALIVRTIELGKISHVVKLAEAVRDFVRALVKLQEEFKKEMEEEGIPENKRPIQFISIFLGGLSKHE